MAGERRPGLGIRPRTRTRAGETGIGPATAISATRSPRNRGGGRHGRQSRSIPICPPAVPSGRGSIRRNRLHASSEPEERGRSAIWPRHSRAGRAGGRARRLVRGGAGRARAFLRPRTAPRSAWRPGPVLVPPGPPAPTARQGARLNVPGPRSSALPSLRRIPRSSDRQSRRPGSSHPLAVAADAPPSGPGGQNGAGNRIARATTRRPPPPAAERPSRGVPELEPERFRPRRTELPAPPERGRLGESPEAPRERSRPHNRAGEPGYVPRRERLRAADQGSGRGAPSPGLRLVGAIEVEPDIESREFLAADDESADEAEGPASRAETRDGKRRRRRRGRRRDRDRPELEAAPGVRRGRVPGRLRRLGPRSRIRPVVPPRPPMPRTSRPASSTNSTSTRSRTPRTSGSMTTTPSSAASAPSQPRVVEEEIDPELEQEIRKEIEEIEELEREMGLRGPVEARAAPRRRAGPPGRPLGPGPRPGQAADPGDLPPRRRGARPGHQGEHRHQGADPLHLHQHPRPLPGADARPEPRRRLAQDRRRRPAPQAPRDHARAEPAQGPGLHRPDRRPGANQARAGPRPGLPAPALEGHPPPDQEDQGARRRSTRNRT